MFHIERIPGILLLSFHLSLLLLTLTISWLAQSGVSLTDKITDQTGAAILRNEFGEQSFSFTAPDGPVFTLVE